MATCAMRRYCFVFICTVAVASAWAQGAGERRGPLANRFQQLDANGDGLLSGGELPNSPWVKRAGTQVNAFERWMLKGPRTKHWMRTWFTLRSVWLMKRDAYDPREGRERALRALETWQRSRRAAGAGKEPA